ncbi:MAG TPA: hypothetical protein DER07_08270 [Armatimonadetes bacterium]|nr:hypothetical protein [Armatimonadota bacterium]
MGVEPLAVAQGRSGWLLRVAGVADGFDQAIGVDGEQIGVAEQAELGREDGVPAGVACEHRTAQPHELGGSPLERVLGRQQRPESDWRKAEPHVGETDRGAARRDG